MPLFEILAVVGKRFNFIHSPLHPFQLALGGGSRSSGMNPFKTFGRLHFHRRLNLRAESLFGFDPAIVKVLDHTKAYYNFIQRNQCYRLSSTLLKNKIKTPSDRYILQLFYRESITAVSIGQQLIPELFEPLEQIESPYQSGRLARKSGPFEFWQALVLFPDFAAQQRQNPFTAFWVNISYCLVCFFVGQCFR